MPNWIFSLQFRLIAGFALVLGLALFSVSRYVGAESSRQAERAQRERNEVRAVRVESILSRFFEARQDWADVQPTLEQAGSLYGWQIVVQDEDGKVVGDSHLNWTSPLRPSSDYRLRSIEREGKEVGMLQFTTGRPFFPGAELEPMESQLASRVNRSLLWTGLAAGAAGIAVVGLLSRRVLAPVSGLSSAARRLGRGDLSQRVDASARDEIGELGRTFNIMAEELEQAEHQRRNLMADVAHELRTPLSNIQGYVEALRDGLVSPEAETIETLHHQVLHLTHLVEDLRLLALAEAGSLRLYRTPDQLGAVVRAAETAFRPRAEAKGVTISIDAPDDLPLVSIDRSRVQQVVQNLVENAIFHTLKGGAISIVATVAADTLRVTVADSGDGIAAADLEHIFDRFYRVDPSRTRATGGAGLGLTIAKQLIEAHDGRLWAESTPGEGSRFIFELPVAYSTDFENEG
jgi:signal transduction histidine kinase